jgi:hypothetical protein
MNKVDYDGDGNDAEGAGEEFAGVREKLYAGILAYAKEVGGKDIVYSPAAYPYFFYDTNGNGEADPEEAIRDNRYLSFTPRLLTAAYNYQYSMKDPGAFTHNPKYVIQVMYDSIASLNEKLTTPIDMATMVRPETPAP